MEQQASTGASQSDNRTRELTLLLQITGAANRSADIKEITESTLGVLSQAVPFDLAFFLLVNPLAGRLELATPLKVPREMSQRLERIPLPEGFYKQVQDPEYGAYSLSDLVVQVRQVVCDHGFQNPITVPLLAEHKGMGILALCSTHRDPREEFLSHADLLDSVGTSVGLALLRAQLGEQLRASEQRYHDFVDNSPEGFWEYAPGQRVTLVNQAALDIIGYSREEVEGKTFAGITVESEQRIRELGDAIRRDGSVKDWRFEIRTKQGKLKTLSLAGRFLQEEGKPGRWQLTFRDVSSRVEIEQALKGKVKELRSLARVGDLLSRSPGSKDALTDAAVEIQRVFAADSAHIVLKEDGATRSAASSIHLRRPSTRLHDYQRHILQSPQPVSVDNRDDPEVDTEQREWLKEIGVRAYLAAPLISGSRSIGILFVNQSKPRHWTNEETRLAATLANQIAGDVQQASLIQELRTRLHELQIFADTSDLASSMIDERAAIELTLDAIKDLLQVDIAGVQLLEGDHFRSGRVRGASSPASPLEMTPLVRQILNSNELFVFDPEEQAGPLDVQANERMKNLGARSIMAIRLSVATGPLGLVTVASRADRIWKPGEQLALKTIASQLAIAISNARVYHEQLDRARRLRLLVSFGETCGATAHLETLLLAAVEKVKQMLGASSSTIRLVKGDTLSTHIAAGLPDELDAAAMPIYPILRRILDSQEPWPVDDLSVNSDLPAEYTSFLIRNGIKSALLVPVVVKGRTEALLGVYFATPHRWKDQEVQFAQAIGHTLALSLDRARLFESLFQEKSDTSMILDSVFSGVFTTNQAGVIQTWNRAAAVMTGLPADRVKGRNWSELARIEESEPDDLIFEAMENNRVVFGVRSRKITKADGGTIPAAEAAAPLFDTEGNIRGAVGAFWDRTKETQAERMKREFLAQMSHELRNSLTVVMSMASLLRDPKVRGVTRERAIQVTGRQVDRLQDFADRFLRFESKHFKEQLELSPVELAPLLKEAASTVRAQHPSTEIRIPQGKWRVLAEEEHLRTVLLNLLDNAAKYSPADRPIEVRVARADGHRIEVAVHSRGSEIPAEAQEHIFDRGFRAQLNVPDGKPVEGSGIGLWLVKAQLLECGSDIQVTSSQAEGTTFRFTLSEAQGYEQEQSADPGRGRRQRRRRRASRSS